MKTLLSVLGILTFALAVAQADPNDLSGGVMITHYGGEGTYRYAPPPCDRFETVGISDCESQINNMPAQGYFYDTIFYVVAAWGEEKVWCGTEFGISTDFNERWYFIDYGPCLVNYLENSTYGWPGPGEGTAVVATDIPWEGNFVPVYYFIGYAYYDDTIPLDVDPSQDFAGFGNCEVPAQAWDAECLGAMGIGSEPGTPCCPGVVFEFACCSEDGECLILTGEECDALGWFWRPGADCEPNTCNTACCFADGSCQILTLAECDQAEGIALGLGTDCESESCSHACCFYDGTCIFMLPGECAAAGGVWYPQDCEPVNPCPGAEIGACCLYTGECRYITSYECTDIGGYFYEELTCDPNPCPWAAMGACCLEDAECLYVSAYECVMGWGGIFLEGETCEPVNPCWGYVTYGACCLDNGDCHYVWESRCAELGGLWIGGLGCDPNPCDPTPARKETWGSIKARHKSR